MDNETSHKAWYERYYDRKGKDRNDLRTNRGVLFQTMAWEVSLIKAFGNIIHDFSKATVLDVGCGAGGDIYNLLRVGYNLKNITGIDIQKDVLIVAEDLYPQSRFIHGDAARMDLSDNQFDLLFESTMFATLPNNQERAAIASEMIRVCKTDGYLVLVDWHTPKPRAIDYKALTKKELRKLFSIGTGTRLIGIYRGALVPPVGRFLSKYLPSLYFMVAAFFPFLVGQVAYVLKKENVGRYGQAIL